MIKCLTSVQNNNIYSALKVSKWVFFQPRNKKKLGKDILKRKVSHHALRSLGGFLLSAIVKIQLEKSKKGGK